MEPEPIDFSPEIVLCLNEYSKHRTVIYTTESVALINKIIKIIVKINVLYSAHIQSKCIQKDMYSITNIPITYTYTDNLYYDNIFRDKLSKLISSVLCYYYSMFTVVYKTYNYKISKIFDRLFTLTNGDFTKLNEVTDLKVNGEDIIKMIIDSNILKNNSAQ